MANASLSFNTDAMRGIAQQITLKANQALIDHASSWQRMQGHLQDYPAPLQDLLFSIANAHQKRMSQTYHWQLAFADALFSSADAAEQMEAEIAQSFSF